ncbi:hypothetical protein PHMEG_00010677 [Phytophthora megakarya]|uniref:Uncharacterized protein n=1 Tax=Phytophthora megakarya TaxID=4795 RepID=A0A225WEU2_9STRA|nr:hypothetical protein PHMEG_00010677 [Phytophthora megakarya]
MDANEHVLYVDFTYKIIQSEYPTIVIRVLNSAQTFHPVAICITLLRVCEEEFVLDATGVCNNELSSGNVQDGY